MVTILADRAPPSTPIDVARERYSGWLDVQRTVSSGLDSYRTESIVDFSMGWIELRRFKWSRPLESVWHTGSRCYVLTIVLDGCVDADRRNVTTRTPAHGGERPYGGSRVQLVPPGQTICSASPHAGEVRSMRCFIDADFVESICLEKPSSQERAQLGTTDFNGGVIEWLLLRMYREINNAEVGMDLAIEGIARELAVEIVRAIERRRRDTRHHSGGLPSWRMHLMVDRVYAEGPLPKVNDLAEICGITVRHLGRAFQAETGKTIGKFIAAAMAERASKMLKSGIPVGTVAATLGYSTSSSFRHAFYRETGLLPSSLRAG
jgi:AraC family transcriptional regulator